MNASHFYWLTIMLVLFALLPVRGAERSVPSMELPPGLSQIALQRGKTVAGETFSLLSSNLMNVMKTGGVSNAVPFCSAAAIPLTRSIATQYGAEVKRVSHKARNPANKANEQEWTVLQSFRTALEASTNPPSPHVVMWSPGKVTFMAPILISNTLCLQCHGVSGKELNSQHEAMIRRWYPNDEAVGFQMGQLRGAWRIDFRVEDLLTRTE